MTPEVDIKHFQLLKILRKGLYFYYKCIISKFRDFFERFVSCNHQPCHVLGSHQEARGCGARSRRIQREGRRP